MIFDSVKDFINRELQWSKVFHRFMASEDLVGQLRVLASCKQVTPGVGLKRGWELHVWISTSLQHHSASRSDWRRPSSPLLTGFKDELEKGPLSSW